MVVITFPLGCGCRRLIRTSACLVPDLLLSEGTCRVKYIAPHGTVTNPLLEDISEYWLEYPEGSPLGWYQKVTTLVSQLQGVLF
ncbi:hypothetical protein JCGZ_01987 [Jatropha curcas]|uniref:Uncharacterized protein n=1 Tax=Jatropha curcas TaxID=180498 RepID=A0A067JGA3_JATCU|nr:hypothetical protein JCGZ_01987 [Jatropha curcas]